MKIAPKTWAKVVIPLAVFPALAGCATVGPPARIQTAVHTMNRYMPEYVTEANKALDETNHSDKERLIGIGERLEKAMSALDAWANPPEKTKKEKDQ